MKEHDGFHVNQVTKQLQSYTDLQEFDAPLSTVIMLQKTKMRY
jgi:hypothetical protein